MIYGYARVEPVQRYCSDTLLTAQMKDDNSTRGDIEWIL